LKSADLCICKRFRLSRQVNVKILCWFWVKYDRCYWLVIDNWWLKVKE
jgi:hypothetical protein